MYYNNYYGNNRGFVLPFITGALVGGAAVGISRPRPIIANQGPYPYQPYPPYGYQPYPYRPYPYY